MPLRPSQRKHRTKTVTVDYDGEKIDVTYRPAVITPRFTREFTHDKGDMDRDRLTTGIERAVVEWDVLDEHDQKIPPTVENTADFESPFLDAVLTAVFQDMRPTPTTGDGSFSG